MSDPAKRTADFLALPAQAPEIIRWIGRSGPQTFEQLVQMRGESLRDRGCVCEPEHECPLLRGYPYMERIVSTVLFDLTPLLSDGWIEYDGQCFTLPKEAAS